jgi:peptidoglycan/LPS O-acetylase OafA/YrhL
MDATSSAMLVAAVVGTVQVVKHTFGDTRITGFLTIVTAIAVGVLAGVYNVQGLTVGTGVLTALGAIGVSTLADRLGTPSTNSNNVT